MHDHRFDNINTVASKEADRKTLAAEVASYLIGGGAIQRVETGRSGLREPQNYGRAYRPKSVTVKKGRSA